MTETDRRDVGRAAKLLAKAESTDSPEEAVALALRAYSLVADWLNTREPSGAGARRWERRLLRDRRSMWRAMRSHLGGAATPVVPASPYAREATEARASHLDLRA